MVLDWFLFSVTCFTVRTLLDDYLAECNFKTRPRWLFNSVCVFNERCSLTDRLNFLHLEKNKHKAVYCLCGLSLGFSTEMLWNSEYVGICLAEKFKGRTPICHKDSLFQEKRPHYLEGFRYSISLWGSLVNHIFNLVNMSIWCSSFVN